MKRFGVTIKRADIPGLFNEGYYSVLRIYNRYKRFGLPYGGGWANNPEYIINLIEAFITVEENARAQQDKPGKQWQSQKS